MNPNRLAGVAIAVSTFAVTLTACGETGTTGTAAAGDDGYSRPVEMVIPFGPGGGSDSVARAVGAGMGDALGVDVPAINVPGATGSTGMTKMLSAKPGEAITILIQDTLATVESGSASFALDDIQPICRLQSMPSGLMVRPGDFSSWEEVAAAGKKEPLKVATVGTNSVDDIVLASLTEKFGTQFRAVPFAEPSERYSALLSGEVDVLYEQLGDVRQYLDADQFIPVVVMDETPPKEFADVPTAADLGLPEDVVLPQFRGIVTNADASQAQVEALGEACAETMKLDEMTSFQESVYASDDSYQDGEDFEAFLGDQADLIRTQLESYGISD